MSGYASAPPSHPPSYLPSVTPINHSAYQNNFNPGTGYGAVNNFYPTAPVPAPAATGATLAYYQPVYPISGQLPEPPTGSIMGEINNAFNFEAYRSPIYGDMLYTAPIAQEGTYMERESARESFVRPGCCGILCGTLARLKTILLFTIALPALLVWMLHSLSRYNAADYDKGTDFGREVMLYQSTMLFALFLVYYLIFVVLPALRYNSGTCCGIRNILYQPLHKALAATDRSINNVYAQVNRMDDARPALFIRVEGYQSEREYNRSKFYHGIITNETKSLSKRPIYGFTHYLPVPIASAANVSAAAVELDQWYAQGSDFSAITFRYIFSVTPEDWQYLQQQKSDIEARYRGHQGCHFIHTSLVYALEGVTPVGHLPVNCLDENSRYDKYARPGVNAALYRWHSTCEDDKSGDAQAFLVVEKDTANCLGMLWFNRFTMFAHVLAFLYIPYVWLFRLCYNETTFTHRKFLRVQTC